MYETFLTDLPTLGSVCSGGRYNNLASLYTKENLPGVGSSIGLDRLVAGLEELKSPLLANNSSADVMIIYRPEELEKDEKAARVFRDKGIRTDVYLSPEHKSKRIFDYADKNSIPYSLSFKENAVSLKCHKTRETKEYSDVFDAVEGIKI